MPKDETTVKSFRVPEDMFNQANEIFKREGFSFSEAIRLLFEATIKEDRIPRSLSNKEIEKATDIAATRENYVDSILNKVIPEENGESAEERLLRMIFGEHQSSKTMQNTELREWAEKWGLPENLSVATIADLYDSDLFSDDPWVGDYVYDNDPNLGEDLVIVLKMKDNLIDNLEKVKKKMQINAVKYLMEYDINNRYEEFYNEEDEDEEEDK